jgi:chaperone required for assembly of F1-ATPase
LPEEQIKKLKDASKRSGLPMAELIRQCIDSCADDIDALSRPIINRKSKKES